MAKTHRVARIASCHPDRKHSAHGMCGTCYKRSRFPKLSIIASRLYRHKVKARVMEAYGGKCGCCGETEIDFLSIDHINNDGADHRRQIKVLSGFAFYLWLQRQGFPQESFQCLCMNCNFGKLKTGICPHKRNEEKQ